MTDIRRVAVISTGVIGASWAALFLAHGLDVTATDPALGAETALRASVAAAWPALTALGLAAGADPARLRFVATLAEAVAEADFVQENGPEDLALKQALFARLDAAAQPEAVIASSSSSLLMTEVARECPGAARILLGHPFNPPHLIPLVEVVGGKLTADGAVQAAMAFYQDVGKRPIHVRRELPGHVANRLQAALWREAFGLVHSGAATVADIDTAIAHGPGLRWALLGPFMNLHLSGGAGGMRHLLDHLGQPMDDWWQDLFATRMTEAIKAEIVAGSAAVTEGRDMAATVRARDALLIDLLRAKAAAADLP